MPRNHLCAIRIDDKILIVKHDGKGPWLSNYMQTTQKRVRMSAAEIKVSWWGETYKYVSTRKLSWRLSSENSAIWTFCLNFMRITGISLKNYEWTNIRIDGAEVKVPAKFA